MKKLNKFFAVLVALAMMATLCVCMAFAEGEAPTATPDNAKLVKYLEVPEGTAVPTVVNVFTFTPNEEASSNVTAEDIRALFDDSPIDLEEIQAGAITGSDS